MFLQRLLIYEPMSAPTTNPAKVTRMHFNMGPQIAGPPELHVTNATRIILLAEMLTFMQFQHPFNTGFVFANVAFESCIRMDRLHMQQHRPFRCTDFRTEFTFEPILFDVMDFSHMHFQLILALEIGTTQVAFHGFLDAVNSFFMLDNLVCRVEDLPANFTLMTDMRVFDVSL